MNSWSHPYQGNVAELLYDYMNKQASAKLYARILPIVQSSGMGKSRMIDQLAKARLVLPLNLRKGYQGKDLFHFLVLNFIQCAWIGYPAPDGEVREWLSKPDNTKYECRIRFTAFLTAIFENTTEVLLDIDDRTANEISASKDLAINEQEAALKEYAGCSTLPQKFRFFMSVGQKFKTQGELRRNFYSRVLARADRVSPQRCTSPMLTRTAAVQRFGVRNSPRRSPRRSSKRRIQIRYLLHDLLLTIS
jgi:hypothetical protein